MLKEYLVYSTQELQTKFVGYITAVDTIKNQTTSQIVNTFLNYELHIATEAVLNGEQGAMKASKMIDKLITKIKEEKEWLSSLD